MLLSFVHRLELQWRMWYYLTIQPRSHYCWRNMLTTLLLLKRTKMIMCVCVCVCVCACLCVCKQGIWLMYIFRSIVRLSFSVWVVCTGVLLQWTWWASWTGWVKMMSSSLSSHASIQLLGGSHQHWTMTPTCCTLSVLYRWAISTFWICVIKYTRMNKHTQILVLYDSVNVINVEGVVSYIHSLQQSDGSFIGDKWGEMMHAYCNDIVMMSLLIIQEKLTQGFRSVVLLH